MVPSASKPTAAGPETVAPSVPGPIAAATILPKKPAPAALSHPQTPSAAITEEPHKPSQEPTLVPVMPQAREKPVVHPPTVREPVYTAPQEPSAGEAEQGLQIGNSIELNSHELEKFKKVDQNTDPTKKSYLFDLNPGSGEFLCVKITKIESTGDLDKPYRINYISDQPAPGVSYTFGKFLEIPPGYRPPKAPTPEAERPIAPAVSPAKPTGIEPVATKGVPVGGQGQKAKVEASTPKPSKEAMAAPQPEKPIEKAAKVKESDVGAKTDIFCGDIVSLKPRDKIEKADTLKNYEFYLYEEIPGSGVYLCVQLNFQDDDGSCSCFIGDETSILDSGRFFNVPEGYHPALALPVDLPPKKDTAPKKDLAPKKDIASKKEKAPKLIFEEGPGPRTKAPVKIVSTSKPVESPAPAQPSTKPVKVETVSTALEVERMAKIKTIEGIIEALKKQTNCDDADGRINTLKAAIHILQNYDRYEKYVIDFKKSLGKCKDKDAVDARYKEMEKFIDAELAQFGLKSHASDNQTPEMLLEFPELIIDAYAFATKKEKTEEFFDKALSYFDACFEARCGTLSTWFTGQQFAVVEVEIVKSSSNAFLGSLFNAFKEFAYRECAEDPDGNVLTNLNLRVKGHKIDYTDEEEWTRFKLEYVEKDPAFHTAFFTYKKFLEFLKEQSHCKIPALGEKELILGKDKLSLANLDLTVKRFIEMLDSGNEEPTFVDPKTIGISPKVPFEDNIGTELEESPDDAIDENLGKKFYIGEVALVKYPPEEEGGPDVYMYAKIAAFKGKGEVEVELDDEGLSETLDVSQLYKLKKANTVGEYIPSEDFSKMTSIPLNAFDKEKVSMEKQDLLFKKDPILIYEAAPYIYKYVKYIKSGGVESSCAIAGMDCRPIRYLKICYLKLIYNFCNFLFCFGAMLFPFVKGNLKVGFKTRLF